MLDNLRKNTHCLVVSVSNPTLAPRARRSNWSDGGFKREHAFFGCFVRRRRRFQQEWFRGQERGMCVCNLAVWPNSTLKNLEAQLNFIIVCGFIIIVCVDFWMSVCGVAACCFRWPKIGFCLSLEAFLFLGIKNWQMRLKYGFLYRVFALTVYNS